MPYDPDIIRHALSQSNPFILRDEQGHIMVFSSPKKAYLFVLTSLNTEFPLGFVDLAYFMLKYQRISPFRVFQKLGHKEYCYVRVWDTRNVDRLKKLRLILCKLLSVSECPFDESSFGDALKDFDAIYEKMKLSENYQMYDNLNVIENGTKREN